MNHYKTVAIKNLAVCVEDLMLFGPVEEQTDSQQTPGIYSPFSQT